MAFTVDPLAKLTGITVRTLHHYDEIGLVQPSERSPAGYRLYSDDDVLRLQQVLVYKELGLPLDEIAAVLDDPAFSRTDALERHREALLVKRGKLDRMLASIDAAIGIEKGNVMEVKSLFDGFDHEEHAEEAARRWGNTYRESARRTKRYAKPEWDAIRREGDAVFARFAELMAEGAPAADARVRAAVVAQRDHITRWFYPCSAEIQRGLAEMFVADERFTQNIDRATPGLARYIRDAITD
ncbi:MAG TPA: MerR family transcriptional regulator [Kofleriaceae bacterium]|jgi:DNA-binding transcriptional MerR regulator|nr:MerR family transcriptional regulator [Kofleriaceae bacterium]